MIRPASIVRYEQFYLASLVLSVLSSVLTWSTRAAIQAANPMLAEMPWIVPATFVFGIGLALLLWYFTARRPSVVAKWVVVVFAGFAVIGILMNLGSLALGTAPSAISVAVAIVSSGLYIVAAVLLFRPDAKAWFGEDGFGAEPRA